MDHVQRFRTLIARREPSSLPVPKNKQGALSQANLLSALVESLTDAVFVKDRHGRYLYCNEATAGFVNRSVSEVVGNDDRKLFDAESAAAIAEFDRQVMKVGVPSFREEEIVSGSKRYTFLVTKAPYCDEHGEVLGIVGLARDITAEKRAKESLRESERRRAEGEKLAHVGYWERDLVADRSDWSDEIYRIYGVPLGQNISAADWWSMIHPEDRPRVRQKADQALVEKATIELEYRIVRSDGDIRVVQSRGRTTFDESGRPLNLFGVMQDITEYRAAQEALRTSEQELSAAQRVAKLGNWRLQAGQKTVRLSKELYRLLGLEEISFRGTLDEILEKIHPDDHQKILVAIDRAIGERRDFEIEYRVPQAQNAERIIRAIGQAEITEGGNVAELFGTAQDITEQKRIEADREDLHQEVLASRAKLSELSRRILDAHESERRKLAHELHDDIGQILTAVKLSLQSLHSDADSGTASRLEDSIHIVIQAIDQVRDLSLSLWPASIELLGVEAAIRAFVSRESARAQLEVEFNCALQDMALSRSLEAICFRIVQKALTNVLRHANAKHCWVTLYADHETLQVSVRDDGGGFDVQAAYEEALQGRGFGLLGMYETVQLLDGELEIQSTLGAGTVVSARLPLAKASKVPQ